VVAGLALAQVGGDELRSLRPLVPEVQRFAVHSADVVATFEQRGGQGAADKSTRTRDKN